MRKWISGLLAGLLIVIVSAGCGKAPAVSAPPDSSEGGVLTLPTESEASTTQPPVSNENLNPLTGKSDLTKGGTRPVGVMIGNNSTSRPQHGIDKADLYVEAETEGGITRILALFANAERIPAQLGPVRSARSPFVTIAQAMDIVYAHAGGSTPALDTLKKIKIDNINALSYDGSTFWRDEQLKKSKGLEYSMMTSGDKMKARMDKLKIGTTATRPVPFGFGDKAGNGAGASLQVNVSDSRAVTFVYDSTSGLYTKGNGKIGDTTTHKAADGTPIQVTNILVMYADKVMENELTCNFKLASGSGLLVTGGTKPPDDLYLYRGQAGVPGGGWDRAGGVAREDVYLPGEFQAQEQDGAGLTPAWKIETEERGHVSCETRPLFIGSVG